MNKKKIMLFGATGMAGHLVYLYLKSTGDYEIIPVVYRNKLTSDCILLDVRDTKQVSNLIKAQKPNVIINCIGVLVKRANENPEEAILLNSYLPHFMAKVADEVGAKLIHISTDCVFSGKKGSYSESDPKDAEDIYGRTKALGELVSNKHLTLRTSIIGPEIKESGTGLFNWFMNQSGEVNGYTEAFWGGITTLELAKAIEKSIVNDLTGLMHVTNGEKISKYALISSFKSIWCMEAIQVKEFKGKAVDKSLLKSTKFNFNVPGYEEMLIAQKGWMDSHADLYAKLYPATGTYSKSLK